MIATPLIVGALGVASVIAGAALLEDRPSTSLRRSLLNGATIGLWLLLWFVAASLAMANAELLTKIFGSSQAPRRATIASAVLSWFCAVMIARGLVGAIRRGPRHPTVPGVLVSLAWAVVLIVPWLIPGRGEGPGSGPGVLALTVMLAALVVPVSRI